MELVDDITDQEAEDLARHLFDNFKGKLGKSIKNICLFLLLNVVLKPKIKIAIFFIIIRCI